MVVEALLLNFLTPGIVMYLHVVQNCIDKHSNVGVLVRKQLKHDRNHLSLIEDYLTCRTKEQKFEKSVKDLLNHFIVFLFRT
jgi:hypothetical protein